VSRIVDIQQYVAIMAPTTWPNHNPPSTTSYHSNYNRHLIDLHQLHQEESLLDNTIELYVNE